MPSRLPRDCWVCGEPFSSGEYKLDEFGSHVHLDCYDKLIAEAVDRLNPKP